MMIIDFKISDVSFQELAKALTDLGFKDKSDSKYFRFYHKKKDTKVLLPSGKKTDILDKTSLVATALILKGREVIKKFDVLEKLIEKNRMLSEQSAA